MTIALRVTVPLVKPFATELDRKVMETEGVIRFAKIAAEVATCHLPRSQRREPSCNTDEFHRHRRRYDGP